jgi:serpin B
MGVAVRRVQSPLFPLIIAVLAGSHPTQKPIEPVPRPGLLATLPLFRPTSSDRENLPAIVRANNAFALALYERLRTEPGNLLVSPACLSAGLALVHTGARGETAQQVARALHLPDDLARTERAYSALIQDLNADAADRTYQIRLANAIWVQDGYPLLASFRSTLKDVFALDSNRVDFSGTPEQACRAINAWTESRTGGKITGTLRPADLPADTRLILTNALYLRANWTERFRRELTHQDAYHVASGETVRVDMMNDNS